MISDQIQYSISVNSSPCKALVINLGLECVYLIEAQSYQFYHFKECIWPKESCLSVSFQNSQLLIFLVNAILRIFFFIAPQIPLTNNGCMSYLVNQILLHSMYPNWLHVFSILEFLSLLSMSTKLGKCVTNCKEMICYIYHVKKMILLFKEFLKSFKLIYLCCLLINNLMPQMVHLIIILIVIRVWSI